MKFDLRKRYKEKGNVLFLILIAVALFAALSYAVTQSTRSGGGSGDNETALINSAQLTQYPATVRTAVMRMIIRGTNMTDLEFVAPANFATECTNTGVINFDWCVFHPEGGGETWAEAPNVLMAAGSPGAWVYNYNNRVLNLGTSGAGATGNDLIAFLPGITDTLCARINEELRLGTTTGITGDMSANWAAATNMDSASTAPTGVGFTIGATNGTSDAALIGQPFGCFVNDTATPGINVYYHVLVER